MGTLFLHVFVCVWGVWAGSRILLICLPRDGDIIFTCLRMCVWGMILLICLPRDGGHYFFLSSYVCVCIFNMLRCLGCEYRGYGVEAGFLLIVLPRDGDITFLVFVCVCIYF